MMTQKIIPTMMIIITMMTITMTMKMKIPFLRFQRLIF